MKKWNLPDQDVVKFGNSRSKLCVILEDKYKVVIKFGIINR